MFWNQRTWIRVDKGRWEDNSNTPSRDYICYGYHGQHRHPRPEGNQGSKNHFPTLPGPGGVWVFGIKSQGKESQVMIQTLTC